MIEKIVKKTSESFYVQQILDAVVLGTGSHELDFVTIENQPHLLDVERRFGVIVNLRRENLIPLFLRFESFKIFVIGVRLVTVMRTETKRWQG